jgi:hypothetical protein
MGPTRDVFNGNGGNRRFYEALEYDRNIVQRQRRFAVEQIRVVEYFGFYLSFPRIGEQ